ncbi:MAG: LPS-assembly lipoprotein LptE [Pollutimonas bauzanensis]
MRGLACVALCLLLAACGFRLKGVSPLPFTTIYTNIPDNSAFGANMRRAIVASSPRTRFVSEPADAQARLTQLSNNQSLRELSIDAQGRVEEYELNLEFVFQLTDARGHLVLPPTTLRATREIPYDDTIVQAKQGEIGTIFQEMQQSMVDRVVRRLASPDVAEAFADAESLPVDESPAGAAPTPPSQPMPGAPPWGGPRIDSGAGGP